MGNFLDKIKRNGILSGAGIILLGLLLLLFPVIVTKIASYIIGIGVFGFGAIKIIRFFSKNSAVRVSLFGLIVGIISAILGVYFIANPRVISDFTVSIFGLIILINGISKLNKSIKLKNSNVKNWWSVLITALINLLLGIVFVTNPSFSYDVMIRIMGVVIMFVGAGEVWSILSVTKQNKSDDFNGVVINSKGEIEGEGREIKMEDID